VRSEAKTVAEYLESLPDDRRGAIEKVRARDRVARDRRQPPAPTPPCVRFRTRRFT